MALPVWSHAVTGIIKRTWRWRVLELSECVGNGVTALPQQAFGLKFFAQFSVQGVLFHCPFFRPCCQIHCRPCKIACNCDDVHDNTLASSNACVRGLCVMCMRAAGTRGGVTSVECACDCRLIHVCAIHRQHCLPRHISYTNQVKCFIGYRLPIKDKGCQGCQRRR
jgi:hypothetical protein